jgi:ligand-binding sensor domain-containing protein
MNQHCLLILLLLLFSVRHLIGQEISENNFDHYTKADGMSHNIVPAIATDSTGYMWASTSFGLNRYNGSHFVQFHTTDDSLSLPSEELMGMTWLDKHRLAVYASGLHIIDTRTGKSRNLFIPYQNKKYQWKFNIIMTAKGDEEGNIFLLTRAGFYHYDKDYRLAFRFDYYKDEEVPTSHFFFGNVFGGDLYRFDFKRLLINCFVISCIAPWLMLYSITSKQKSYWRDDNLKKPNE